MNPFVFDIPTKLLFGFGQFKTLHAQAMPGKKALIVLSSGKAMKTSGYLADLERQLTMAGAAYALFDKIQANPTLTNVREGAAAARENGCDFVVALGGGSTMDAAKAIAFAAANPHDFWEYSNSMTGGNRPRDEKPLPIIAITTTAGTGSEIDQWAVITREDTNEKSGFGDPGCYPLLSIVDPELMMTVPPKFTAYQGMDAFFHAAESMLNTHNHPMGRMFALQAIRYIAKYLPRAVQNGADREARYYVALANTLAGVYELCISEHNMEHAMSGFYPALPHGAGLIMLSRAYYQYFIDLHAAGDTFIEMARAMGREHASEPQDFVRALQELLDACGVSDLSMHAFGIQEADLETLADYTCKVKGGDPTGDPVILSKEDFYKIFKNAY